LLAHLSTIELRIVGIAASNARLIRAPALALTRLGNGWIYLIVALIGFCFEGKSIFPVIVAAIISAGLAHVIYPWLKKWFSRPRPFVVDPKLGPPIQPLDEYSFPSGHIMSLTTVLIPLITAFPNFLIFSVILWGAIAWAQISLALHYPSDVVAGGLLGAAIATPISIYVG
jgi:undecaprenyl-diphosphatase